MSPILRIATDSDFEFAFAAKRSAMRVYIEERWGWDEQRQREIHRSRWGTKPWQVIVVNEERVGTVSLDVRITHLQFGEFYVVAPHRGMGIGTQILKSALAQSDRLGLPTRLEYLKWNPVASLYARHGFHVVGETDTHYLAEREAHAI